MKVAASIKYEKDMVSENYEYFCELIVFDQILKDWSPWKPTYNTRLAHLSMVGKPS